MQTESETDDHSAEHDVIGPDGAARLVMRVGDVAVGVELFDDLAPATCAKLRDHLPLPSTMVHAKFAGHEVIVMVPFFCEGENLKLDVTAGDVGYYPGRQTLCIFYGDVTPFGAVAHVGRVVDNLEGLRGLGARALDEGCFDVELSAVLS